MEGCSLFSPPTKVTFLMCCILKRLWLCVYSEPPLLLLSDTYPTGSREACTTSLCTLCLFRPSGCTTVGNCVLSSVSEINYNYPFLIFSTLFWFSLYLAVFKYFDLQLQMQFLQRLGFYFCLFFCLFEDYFWEECGKHY